MARTLYKDRHHRIELHRRWGRSKGLVYSFSSLALTDLAEPAFGLRFLLREGYDVVAFKCDNGSWFQELDIETLREVARWSDRYDHVATYGSSMGGYAAIAFSGILKADLVLAFSPQHSPTAEFEFRWHEKTKALDWRHPITPQTVAPKARYRLVYDDVFLPDVRHVNLLLKDLPPETTELVPVRFSNHHTLIFLLKTGRLQPAVRALLAGEPMVALDYRWSVISKMPDFFHSLGQYARRRGRAWLGRMCLERCLRMVPGNPLYEFILSEIPQNPGARPSPPQKFEHRPPN